MLVYLLCPFSQLCLVTLSFFSALSSIAFILCEISTLFSFFFFIQWEKPPRSVAEAFVLLLAPYAPHMAEELWSRLGHSNSLAYETFPKVWIVFICVALSYPACLWFAWCSTIYKVRDDNTQKSDSANIEPINLFNESSSFFHPFRLNRSHNM